MKIRLVLVVLALFATVPAVARAQTGPVTAQGAVGAILNGTGHDLSIGVGFWPTDRVGIIVSAERIHVPTEVTQYENSIGLSRGGTSTFVSGELRVVPRAFTRVSPYFLGGAGLGRAQPNVNEVFPNPVDDFRALELFVGGGVHIPLTPHLSVFGDVRGILQIEDSEAGLYPFLPLRGGVSWRF